jgi:hypothetical protein
MQSGARKESMRVSAGKERKEYKALREAVLGAMVAGTLRRKPAIAHRSDVEYVPRGGLHDQRGGRIRRSFSGIPV